MSSEDVFEDFKEAYTPTQAAVEANRCLFCSDAPCIKACPTEIDIPQFIRKIASENVRGAAKTIFDANILGMSCARVCPVEVLCVGDCVYNHMGVPPIQIGKLQRFATDVAFDSDWRFAEAGKPTGKRVALVGAGPASLACAHELRKLGHACTIYEKNTVVGGLNTTGVAPYKMRADRSKREVEWILGIGGIELETGVNVGQDITFGELEKDHDAVFIGLGLGADSKLGIPGEDLPGIHGAVDFIERMKLGTVDVANVKNAVVIGGGNTAIDCVRELLGLGIPNVTMLYRGTREGMSGYHHEWDAAGVEGAKSLWTLKPLEFVGGDTVKSIRVVKLNLEKSAVKGSEGEVECDLVLVAIGQHKLGSLLRGVQIENGRVVVDRDGCTSNPKYFSGGDCANGGKEVVNAAAEGKRAARAIDRFVRGESHA